jgi:hypothetical protein
LRLDIKTLLLLVFGWQIGDGPENRQIGMPDIQLSINADGLMGMTQVNVKKEVHMIYSISEIVSENGGYGYTVCGPVPCRCWSHFKPDLKKIQKSLQRLNQVPMLGFNNSVKTRGAKK